MGQMGQIFKTDKTIEIQLVRLPEVCGKVLNDKNDFKSCTLFTELSNKIFLKKEKKSVKTAWLLSNGIGVDHQNRCFFTNKGHFSTPLWVLIGVLAKFYE